MILHCLSSNLLFIAIFFLKNCVTSESELVANLPEECKDYMVLSDSGRNIETGWGRYSDNLDCEKTADWKGPGIIYIER